MSLARQLGLIPASTPAKTVTGRKGGNPAVRSKERSEADSTSAALTSPRPATPAKRGRPAGGKEQVTIRLDKDVLAKFKATGEGWQSRINEALRKVEP